MTRSDTESRPAVSVTELQRAWSALQAGQFRSAARQATLGALRPSTRPVTDWSPRTGERVLPVLGCAGSCGASTVALALATAGAPASRVVECATVTESGLAAASTAELGRHHSGWTRGTRGEVLLERASDVLTCVQDVPPPSVPDADLALTVLDLGWEVSQVLTSASWVREHVVNADTVILVTTATVPGLRRLEGALDQLSVVGTRACVAVVGPRRRKWPSAVEHSAGRLTRDLIDDARLVTVAQDRSLAVNGLDAASLPTPLLAAATDLLRLCAADHSTMKGTP